MSNFLVPYAQTMREYTDAPPIFHQASALAAFGALLTRTPHRCVIDVGVNGLWTNLWVLLVGDSGSTRKTLCAEMVQKTMVDNIDPDLRGPNDMSPEGLQNSLRIRDASTNGASIFQVHMEFLSLLTQFRRQYSQTLQSLLLELFDVPTNFVRELKNSKTSIPQPRVSILGGIPPDILSKYSRPEEWDGGFYNRFLIVQGKKERTQRGLPRIPGSVSTGLSTKLKTLLDRWQASQANKGNPWMKVGKDATRIEGDLMPDHDDVNVRTLLQRAQQHFLKVAAIAQVDIDPTATVIGKEAAEYALHFIELWRGSVEHLVKFHRTTGRESFEGDRLAKSIMRLVELKGPTSKRELLRSLGLNYNAYNDAIVALLEANFITIENDVVSLTKE